MIASKLFSARAFSRFSTRTLLNAMKRGSAKRRRRQEQLQRANADIAVQAERLEDRVMLSSVTGQPSEVESSLQTTLMDEIFPGAFIERSFVGHDEAVQTANQLVSGNPEELNNNGLEFQFDAAAGTPQNVIDGFVEAGELWSDILVDDILVNIDIAFPSLAPGILGQTLSDRIADSYSDVRSAIGNDATSANDNTAEANLPVGTDLDIYLNRTNNSPNGQGSATPFVDDDGDANNSTIRLTRANAKALGLVAPGNSDRDAAIAFNSDFTWDFDRSDGISPGASDFVAVAAHEIGHALGFTSGVGLLDNNSPNDMGNFFNDNVFQFVSTLDLFRHSSGSVTNGADIDWTADNRDKFFSIDGGTTFRDQFATGVNHGDGQQASHWKDNLGIGLMDPTLAQGEFGDITANDITAFDVVGWDLQTNPVVDGDNSSNNIRVQISPDDSNTLQVFLDGALINTFALDSLDSLAINGSGGDDTLIVDHSGGNPIPSGGIDYDGGGGSNDLEVQGGDFNNVTTTYTNATDGTVNQDGSMINFQNLQPVLLNVGTANNMVFVLPAAAASDTTLEDNGVAGDDMSQLTSNAGTFETTEFTNPDNTLSILALTQDDTVSIEPLDNQFAASINLFGDGGTNTLNVNNVQLNGTPDDALFASNFDQVTINNSTFNNNGENGIDLNNAGDVTMENVTANGNADTGIDIAGTGSGVVEVTGASSASNNVEHGLAIAASGNVTVTGGTFNDNDDDDDGLGDGIHLEGVGDVVLNNEVEATGNDPGVFVSGAASFSDTDGNYSGNDDHGIHLIDIAGDVDLLRTALENNDDDDDDVGNGLFAEDGGDNDTLSIGGDLTVLGATIRVTGVGTHQEKGVHVTEVVGGDVTFEDAPTGEAMAVTRNEDNGIDLDDDQDGSYNTVTFTNGNYNRNGGNGIEVDSANLVDVNDVTANNNDDAGLDVDEETETVNIDDSQFNNNVDEGMDLDDITTVTIANSEANNNDEEGVNADEIDTFTVGESDFNDNDDDGDGNGEGIDLDGFGTATISFATTNGNDEGMEIADGDLLNVNDWITLNNLDNDNDDATPGGEFTDIGTVSFVTTTDPFETVDKLLIFEDRFQHFRDVEAQQFVGYNGLENLNFFGQGGNDVFVLHRNVPDPNHTVNLFIDGEAPSAGPIDPNAVPGDKLVLADGGSATFTNRDTGEGEAFTPDGTGPVDFTDIEEIVEPDEFEFNDTQASATVLGSDPALLVRASLSRQGDQDWFKVTANQSGALQISLLFTHDVHMDFGVEVYDANGNVIHASPDSGTDNESLDDIPVVSQEMYWVRVFQEGGQDNDFGNYALEIENVPVAPVPSLVDLSPADDTGMFNDDDVTNETQPNIFVQADLTHLADLGIDVLEPGDVGADTVTDDGAAVEIFVNGTAVGFAEAVNATNTLFQFSGFDPTELTSDLGIDLGGGSWLNYVSAAVRIFDAQEDANGNPDPQHGRSQLSEPLPLTVDTQAPDPSTPDMLAASDTGMFNDDDVTSKMQPAFQGTAEPNAKVRVFAGDELVGQGVATSQGDWEITVEPLDDGKHVITTEIEDAAGNISTASQTLDIWVDSTAPNTPYLDLLSDTGKSTIDNITNDNTPDVAIVANDTPDGNGNPFPHDIKWRLFDRPGDADGEVLIAEQAPLSEDGRFEETLTQLEDGVHNLKLEVEDRAGNISHDFLLEVVIDTAAPNKSFGDPNVDGDGLHPDSDSGIADQPDLSIDRITNDTTPTFFGQAEAGSVIRAWVVVDNNDTPADPSDDTEVPIGLTVAEPTDGTNPAFDGAWELTSNVDMNDLETLDPLTEDGVRLIRIRAEDMAGNVTAPMDLPIFIDTRGPQVDSVQIDGQEDFDLFDPKTDGSLAPTPRIDSLDVNFVDEPERVGGGLVAGDEPDVVFVIDVSGSTDDPFQGTSVGDLNGDGNADTILDAEIAGFQALNQDLIDRGLGSVADVSIITFSSGSTQQDMDDMATGTQLTTTPSADTDMNGTPDVVDVLQSLTSGGLTNFEDPLQDAITTFNTLGTAPENGNLIFMSDGFGSGGFADEVATLNGLIDNVRAFGVGANASLNDLQIIDPNAMIFTDTDELLNIFSGVAGGGMAGGGATFLYPAVNETLATQPGNIQLVGDHNGVIPIESIEFQDSTSGGSIGMSTVTLNFFEPLPDDRFTLTVSDRIKDNAGNALDGESNTEEPQEMPQFPSGDGDPGEDFEARFTVDSRPDIGTVGQQGVYVDANGNFTFDPENGAIGGDFVNEDLVFDLGIATDGIFAGAFTAAPGTPAQANGFDRLGGYGQLGGTFRWVLDFNDDGVPELLADADGDGVMDSTTIQPADMQFNGTPVAGEFDGDPANGDEIGLFTGTKWILDTDHSNTLDTDAGDAEITTDMRGLPFVGDFDGDGTDDLGTFLPSANSLAFDFDRDGTAEDSFEFGFPGVLERPVAADFNLDGIDDVGLFVPQRDGVTPEEQAEWFVLISDENAATANTADAVNHEFSPDPVGNDLFAQFGFDQALPVVGNFDPPASSGGDGVAAAVSTFDTATGEMQVTAQEAAEIAVGSSDGLVEVTVGGTVDDSLGDISASEVSTIVVQGSDEGDTLDLSGVEEATFTALTGVSILGGDGDDQLTGSGSDDLINGAGGDDTAHGGAGEDRIFGGAGSDRLIGQADDDKLNGQNGSDLLSGSSGNDMLKGKDGDDSLFGGSGNDVLDGGAGADKLKGQMGHDVLHGGTGDDVLSGAAGNDWLDGGAGNDGVAGLAGNDTVGGGSGFDSLLGGTGDDKLFGGSGNDVALGEEGDDKIKGQLGEDTIAGGDGANVLVNPAGTDVVDEAFTIVADWIDSI